MNPVRHASLALILCTLLPFSANAVDVATLPPGRAASLFNSFEVICNVATPNFEHLTALAAAMRMKVLEDTSETTPDADTLQRKGWFGMLTTGSFALRIEKMSGAKGVATTCALKVRYRTWMSSARSPSRQCI
jgi:hypothetical protein